MHGVCACSNLLILRGKTLGPLTQFTNNKFGQSVNVLTCPLSQFSNKSLCGWWYPVLRIMDFLGFTDVSFPPSSSIEQLCKDLNTIVGQGIWYETFQVQNTKWLWVVKEILTSLNSDSVFQSGLIEVM